MHHKHQLTATIADEGTESGAVDMSGQTMLAILVPTLDSATLEIEGSFDGTNFYDVKDTGGNQVGLWPASVGGFILDGDAVARFVGIPFIRFKTGAAQTNGPRVFKIAVM